MTAISHNLSKIPEWPNHVTHQVITVNEKNFNEEVENSKLPVIIDMYATWCPPCKIVAPIFAKLAEEMKGKIKFVKANINEECGLAEKFQILVVPTFLFFKDGKQVGQFQGALSREGFLERIHQLFFKKRESYTYQ